MKKVLALLLVLAFGAVMASADGVSFGAWMRTNLTLAAGSSVNSKIYQGIGPGWWVGDGQAIDLNLNYNGPVLGAHFEWKTATNKLFDNSNFQNFNVSVNAIPDLLSFRIGQITSDEYRINPLNGPYSGDEDWRMGEYGNGDNLGDFYTAGKPGFAIRLAPKDSGLSVTYYMPIGLYGSGGNSSNTPGNELITNLGGFALLASYTIQGFGKIAAGTTSTSGMDYSATVNKRNYYLGLDITAVKVLGIKVVGQFETQPNDTKWSRLDLLAGLNLGLDAFSASFQAFAVIPTGTSAGTNTSLKFDLDPSYNFGPVSAGVYLSYSTDGASTATTAIHVLPHATISAISTTISLDLEFDATGSTTSSKWCVPVTVDVGF